MTVTREVVYDLLPVYFSGDASPETKALVEDFLQQDPEFSKMMQRFRMVFRDPRPAPADRPTAERETFERARSLMQRRSEMRGYITAFTVAAIVVSAVWLRLRPGGRGSGWIALAFAATVIICWVQLYRLNTAERRGKWRPDWF